MAETGRRRSEASAFRWLHTGFSMPTSFMRWPRFFAPTGTQALWSSLAAVNYVDISVSFVDSVVWSLISAVESVALVSMLIFFFVSYGCTI
nr:uncharacterized protein LOC109164716 [Ipomoea trifida]GMD45496.1 Histone-lysine N-methyltransferase [Ipomoea batatas]GMD46985.1 Histone-lysine N-methyltransferase [Ipomoea batatas]GMD48359.1 Histone-lysine N-methyltransferase [Ipomoea batatas]